MTFTLDDWQKMRRELPNRKEAADRFHAHLDECKQCREQPFDLCPTGAELLEKTAG